MPPGKRRAVWLDELAASYYAFKGVGFEPVLASGRQVTGLSNSEEAAVGLAEIVPLLIEDTMTNLGGSYVRGPEWGSFVAVDGLLITWQNPGSSAALSSSRIFFKWDVLREPLSPVYAAPLQPVAGAEGSGGCCLIGNCCMEPNFHRLKAEAALLAARRVNAKLTKVHSRKSMDQ